jgi:hypothetical protein
MLIDCKASAIPLWLAATAPLIKERGDLMIE